jgi:TonB family protein
VVASAVLPLVAGATTSILFSRHARQVLANDHDLPTAVQTPPEPPLIPQANSSESTVPRDVTPGKSQPEAQRVEPTSQPRVNSTTGNNDKQAVVGRYGRVHSAGDFAVPVAPKRNQFLAEVLPLYRPLGTGSGIWEISSSAPALPKTEAPHPVAIETMEPVAPGRTGGEFVPPKLVSSGLPNYPTLAKRAGAEGDVKIRAHVDTSGHVDSMIVMPGSPILLQEAAMRALLTWKYEPAKLNGQPVSANVEVTMRFREREGQIQSQQAVVDSRSARQSGENVGSLACRVLRHSPLPVCAGASRHADSTPSAVGKLKP